MSKFSESLFNFHFLSSWQSARAVSKKSLFIICAFWLTVATFELLQDVISSALNDTSMSIGDSLSYKSYWLLFIPGTFLLAPLLEKIKTSISSGLLYTISVLLIAALSLIHLLIFSFFLFGISNIIHDNPWDILFLISEKLSTRLYISLSVYSLLTVLYFRLKKDAPVSEATRSSQSFTISIKNGKKTVVLDTGQIKWISSEGPYLFIHTTGKKHIVADSLKNFITRLPDNFYRIHRSTIVNVKMVKELRSRLNGDYDIILNDGNMLRLSRNYSKPLKGILL